MPGLPRYSPNGQHCTRETCFERQPTFQYGYSGTHRRSYMDRTAVPNLSCARPDSRLVRSAGTAKRKNYLQRTRKVPTQSRLFALDIWLLKFRGA